MKKILEKRITLFNTISNLMLQIITVISGFVIPKIILNYFGSEVNGLVSSLNQFLCYISLVEGGITGVLMANLYRPLYEKNKEKINSIMNAANYFYKKISLIFIIYSFILALIYPIIFKPNFSYIYIFSLTIILSISLFAQYCFSLTLRTLLSADKKIYIVALSQSAILIANIILSIISVKIYPNIHFLKLITGILYLLQPLIYNYFVKKYYSINKKTKPDKELLKSRWDGFAVNIAAFIHFSTDITILTLFTDLKIVSIYSVYALVTTGLRSIISSISSAITPTIGHLYAKGNKSELKEKFDLYEYIMFVIIYLIFSVASLLIVPFVMIYTKNISDTNYNQPLFGILLIISEAIYLIKTSHLNLSYSANKFKDIAPSCYIEAIINIVISVILVKKYGLIGVTIGTICGMTYRMIYHVYFTSKKLIERSQFLFYSKLILFTLITILGIIICKSLVSPIELTITNWIYHGLIYTVVFLVLYFIMSLFFYRNEIKKLLGK